MSHYKGTRKKAYLYLILRDTQAFAEGALRRIKEQDINDHKFLTEKGLIRAYTIQELPFTLLIRKQSYRICLKTFWMEGSVLDP